MACKGWGKGKSMGGSPGVFQTIQKPMNGGCSGWGGPAPSWSAKGMMGKGMMGKMGGGGWGWDDGKGKGKGKFGKDKGKGKGKFKAPDVDDPYWLEKVAAEQRIEGDGNQYMGIVTNYSSQGGWGFIRPDDPTMLPEDVTLKIKQSADEARAKGKAVQEECLLYFRKPDVTPGFRPFRDTPVTFQVYTDNKGAGACQIAGI
mmetsp:Transcript_69768/g.130304  ORF Transcript_69768/g.130304 Transcript_69768/m.130304 type:complete len:201 (-) Transcript_69768:75-677(-)